MKKYTTLSRNLLTLIGITFLASCAYTQKTTSINQESETATAAPRVYSEMLSKRARPVNMAQLKTECRCMDDEIDKINSYTEKMRRTKYGFLYQSMGREKLFTIGQRTASLNCQQFN